MKMLDTIGRLYTPENAEKAAISLREGDPDWTYNVVHCPKGTGYSFIEVYDEEGNFLGKI